MATETLIPENEQIGEELRSAYSHWAKSEGLRARHVRLPAPSQIEFHRIGDDIHIHMRGKAVTGNMQTNAAGFEGWALALRFWLKDCGDIILHWERPEPLNRHYARFLYRVQRFEDLFPDWFRVATPEHLADCAVRTGADLFLNVAGATSREPLEAKRETEIERGLVVRYEEVLRRRLELETVDRQFPVGLYRNRDLKDAVFTGGTSAIDIVGVNADQFTLIELKAGNNIMVGALSELLFYASVIRDAVVRDGMVTRFSFGGRTSGPSRSRIGAADVQGTKGVRAILMGEHFHPLLEHPDLFPTLNEAAKRQGELVPLAFEQWKIDWFGEDAPPRLERIGG